VGYTYFKGENFSGWSIGRHATAALIKWILWRCHGIAKIEQLPEFDLGLPHRTWAAFDGTFFWGGRTTVDSAEMSDYMGNSRLGATFGVVISRRQSLKISYFNGVTTRIGTDVRTLGIAYNYILMKGR
jgi:hypothetical protein